MCNLTQAISDCHNTFTPLTCPISEALWPFHLTRSNKNQWAMMACEILHYRVWGCVFPHPNILRPEQELSVQVGSFYEVHVCYGDVSFFSGTETNEGEVFKKLAADGTSSNLDKLQERLCQIICRYIHSCTMKVKVIKLKICFTDFGLDLTLVQPTGQIYPGLFFDCM